MNKQHQTYNTAESRSWPLNNKNNEYLRICTLLWCTVGKLLEARGRIQKVLSEPLGAQLWGLNPYIHSPSLLTFNNFKTIGLSLSTFLYRMTLIFIGRPPPLSPQKEQFNFIIIYVFNWKKWLIDLRPFLMTSFQNGESYVQYILPSI